jgi:MerR family Zn(II)-responsive transcriptional regulator of zntA
MNLSVGELARTAGVHTETIRFYEREGLMPEPDRTSGGHRKFAADDLARLHFIQRAKACGFTLREVKELLYLRESDLATCTDVREKAEQKLAETERKLKSLAELRKHLKKLINDCPGGDVGVDCCNIIKDLEGRPARKKR